MPGCAMCGLPFASAPHESDCSLFLLVVLPLELLGYCFLVSCLVGVPMLTMHLVVCTQCSDMTLVLQHEFSTQTRL